MTETRVKLLLKRTIEHIFPSRVWFPTSNGWASREPTAADMKRRKQYAAQYLINKMKSEETSK